MPNLRQLYANAKSRSARNVLYVGATQAVTLLIPLITLPWLLRVLRPEAYGAYALALAFGSYALIVVDFGFYLTATQRIAQIRDDREELTRYFWAVQSARFLLAVIAIIVSIGVILSVARFRSIADVMLASLAGVLGTLLFPMWLYLGLERMRTVSIVNIVSRLFGIAPIFLFVRSPNDAALAVWINSGTAIIAGLISCYLIVRYDLVGRFALPRVAEIVDVSRDALPIFISGSAFSLYSTSNAIILGIVRDTYQVGLFNAADKIRNASILPINSISSVFYPRVSRLMVENRRQAVRMIVNLTFGLGACMGCVSLFLFFGAPMIVQIVMGHDFRESVPVLRVLAVVPLLVGITTVLGTIAMLNLNMKKQYSWMVVSGGLVNVPLLIFLSALYGATGAAISLAITEILVTLLTILMLFRRGFFKEVFRLYRS
ncbi:flippase [Mycobacterium sp. OTB74]|uniref:flippase n=1 Tax=Mycobacterium sp. OTB74 TaxID=1853452 RepID=UPI00247536AF|nr:flippase [Mycobacterium sp. OTB74]MDH6242419.1 O-antigen/teichoic acid export membrane protein [Mycobacterium sp. OTB74]